MKKSIDIRLNTGRKAELGDVLRYLRMRADQYREQDMHQSVRLVIRDLADEIQHGRHRRT